ncbi:MAG: glutamate--tRNA ligase [Salinispira sp.]
MTVRVRYAPSPTGLQHIGSLRTALFNYFFARSHGGSCILRIEDTDRNRFDPRALDDIYETFSWMGMSFDEGPAQGGRYAPYIQSERHELYREYAHELIRRGLAYTCFCSPQRLEQLREEQKRKGAPQGYDGRCRNLPPELCREKKDAGLPAVIRFALPREGETLIEDAVLGTVRRARRDISPDPVLLKSDGLPTYHLASVVDDHLMEISHVIRAQEWLSSAALHQLLYEAFEWRAPVFLHLPMVLGKDGKKLSKRHGASSVAEFRREGYLPEALMNYVSMLGWSCANREFFTRNELEDSFVKGQIAKSPAVFDYRKLQWYNAHYIKQTSDDRLTELCLPILKEGLTEERAGRSADSGAADSGAAAANVADSGAADTADAGTADSAAADSGAADSGAADINFPSAENLHELMPLAKERMRTLNDITAVLGFLYIDTIPNAELFQNMKNAAQARAALQAVCDALSLPAPDEAVGAAVPTLPVDGADDEGFHAWFEELALRQQVGLGRVMLPVRMALTGSKSSPPLLDCIRLLGRKTVLRRLERGIKILSANIN